MAIHDKACLLGFTIVTAVVQSCLDSGLLATTKALVEFTCPVCNSGFEGYTISSTNTFGGRDRDFLGRAFGEQPIPLLPKTCPKCFYSGYESDFASAVDIPKAVKEQILRQKVLKPLIQIEAGTKPYEIPAYVRYDLIAQTYQLLGKAKEVIAHQFLSASWATR